MALTYQSNSCMKDRSTQHSRLDTRLSVKLFEFSNFLKYYVFLEFILAEKMTPGGHLTFALRRHISLNCWGFLTSQKAVIVCIDLIAAVLLRSILWRVVPHEIYNHKNNHIHDCYHPLHIWLAYITGEDCSCLRAGLTLSLLLF